MLNFHVNDRKMKLDIHWSVVKFMLVVLFSFYSSHWHCFHGLYVVWAQHGCGHV